MRSRARAETFVAFPDRAAIRGSIGLPLFETRALATAAGLLPPGDA
jgi:hypothetical protein